MSLSHLCPALHVAVPLSLAILYTGFFCLSAHSGRQRIKGVSTHKVVGTVLVHGKCLAMVSSSYCYFIVTFIIAVFCVFLLWGWGRGRLLLRNKVGDCWGGDLIPLWWNFMFFSFSANCIVLSFSWHSLRSQLFFRNTHSSFYSINCTTYSFQHTIGLCN